jgi:uncharacterized ubiquitin-like protein YukD
VTYETASGRHDVRIDAEQCVGQGFAVLVRSGKVSAVATPDFFRSRLNERLVSGYRTFADQRVLNGDVLSIVE